MLATACAVPAVDRLDDTDDASTDGPTDTEDSPHTDPETDEAVGSDDTDSDSDVDPHSDTDPEVVPPRPATWTWGDEVVCADPSARLDRVYDPWSPGGAWDAQVFSADAIALYAGGGVAVADIDADGVIDVFRTSDGAGFTWLALEAGGAVDRTAELPALPASTSAVILVDADGDGDLDLHVLGWRAPDALLLQGPGGWTDVAPAWGIEGPAEEDTVGASWADADGDGDLDLYVAVYGPVQDDAMPDHLWQRQADGSFVDRVLPLAANHPLKVAHPFVGAWVDLQGDRRPELFVVRDFGGRRPSAAYALVNDAIMDVGPLGVELRSDSMGLGIGDLNGDGVDDFAVPETLGIDVLVSQGGAWFEGANALGIIQDTSRGQDIGWGAEVVDLDHDGRNEVMAAWGHLSPESGFAINAKREADAVWRWDGRIHVDVGVDWSLAQPGVGRGFVVIDLNGDGWLDVVKQDLRGPTTLHVARCGAEAWIEVEVRDGGPNALGIGADVIVEAGGSTWKQTLRAGGTNYGSSGPQRAHVGLGDLAVVDKITVIWPDGSSDEAVDVPTRRRVLADRRPLP